MSIRSIWFGTPISSKIVAIVVCHFVNFEKKNWDIYNHYLKNFVNIFLSRTKKFIIIGFMDFCVSTFM